MKWFVIAAFLAGTLAAVSSEPCKTDADCPSDSCCGAKTVLHMAGRGVCMKLAKDKQRCCAEAVNKRFLMFCGCEEGFECKSKNEKLDKDRDADQYFASLVCQKKAEKKGETAGEDPTKVKVDQQNPGAPMEIGNGPGGEPPRDDDCEDWEYPC